MRVVVHCMKHIEHWAEIAMPKHAHLRVETSRKIQFVRPPIKPMQIHLRPFVRLVARYIYEKKLVALAVAQCNGVVNVFIVCKTHWKPPRLPNEQNFWHVEVIYELIVRNIIWNVHDLIIGVSKYIKLIVPFQSLIILTSICRSVSHSFRPMWKLRNNLPGKITIYSGGNTCLWDR